MGDVAAVGSIFPRVVTGDGSSAPKPSGKRRQTFDDVDTSHNDGGRCTVFKITIIKIRVVVGPTVT